MADSSGNQRVRENSFRATGLGGWRALGGKGVVVVSMPLAVP